MPFTPFHLGPALFFGLALPAAFSLPTLVVSSVIPDLEPLYIMYFHSGYQLHGFFHSYLGATILAVVVTLVIYVSRSFWDKIMTTFRISQKSSFKKILFTSFVGVYFHVFLDSFLYEMNPFYPLQGNPFVNLLSTYGSDSIVYGFCSITALLGVTIYFFKIIKGTIVLD